MGGTLYQINKGERDCQRDEPWGQEERILVGCERVSCDEI
jgi:hypothetical protein